MEPDTRRHIDERVEVAVNRSHIMKGDNSIASKSNGIHLSQGGRRVDCPEM